MEGTTGHPSPHWRLERGQLGRYSATGRSLEGPDVQAELGQPAHQREPGLGRGTPRGHRQRPFPRRGRLWTHFDHGRGGDFVLLRHDAGGAREVGGDAGRIDVPSIPPRVVRTAENPRHGLPLPVVGPLRVPASGSGEVLPGDIAAQPEPDLGRHLLGQRRRRAWVHRRGRFLSYGGNCPSKVTLLPSGTNNWQVGSVPSPWITSGSQKTGCANRRCAWRNSHELNFVAVHHLAGNAPFPPLAETLTTQPCEEVA